MKKSPDYTIRIRPNTEQTRPRAQAPTVRRSPKIKLNTSPVAVVQAEAEPASMSDIPEISIEEIETIGFKPKSKSLFARKKWTGYTFKPPRNMFRLSAVAGGAVAIGLLLGYVVLQTFAAEEPPPAGEKAPFALGQTQQNEQKGAGGQTPAGQGAQGQALNSAVSGQTVPGVPSPVTTPKTNPLTITLPVVPLYMVQGGVFSTKAGAQQEQAVFQQKGWPTHMEEDAGKHTLFLGVSASRDDALALAQAYRASKQEVYIKEKSLPAGTLTLSVPETLPRGTAEEIKQFGRLQADLFQTVSLAIGGGFKEGKVPQAVLDKMLTQHREALQRGRSVTTVLDERSKALLQNALNEMTTAVTTLQQFASQPNRTYLWQAEENMLQFISSYKQWQQAITR